jgi:hypothetical protein
MVYDAPVLLEVGQAANLVLGAFPVSGENLGGGGSTQAPALALGLDD